MIAMLAGAIQTTAAAEPAAELRIGLPRPMFKDVPQAMVNAAARPFQSMIQDKAGVKGTVEVVADYKALAEKMKDGKIDIGVFHGFEYAWVKDTPGLIPMVSTVPNCGKIQACLVVKVDSAFKEPKDLKGACVVVPSGSKAHCHMYLERLRERLPAGDCCPAKNGNLSPEAALGEVAVGDADAAIVDVSSLVALERAIPGCYKQLRILAQSELLPSAVVVYRKEALNAATVAKIRNGLIDCVNTPIGKMFALFWQLKGFEDVSPAYHAHVARSLAAYPEPKSIPAAPPAPAPKK
ncbi:MAG: hypothetical protein C0467_22030 [Planctomycetaceae bacterium]|nr:hypothetical protein [Planctomycetaceae bacterium]